MIGNARHQHIIALLAEVLTQQLELRRCIGVPVIVDQRMFGFLVLRPKPRPAVVSHIRPVLSL